MTPQPEWLDTDYYRILGVGETASDKEIRTAYRNLARTAHPDANPDDPGAEERFKAITAAYDVLGDTERRREYDELRRLGPAAVGTPGRGSYGDGRIHVNVTDLGDLGHLGNLGGFGGFFGDFFGSPGPGSGHATSTGPRARPRREGRPGRDLATEVSLPFTQAVYGTTTTINLTSEATCNGCDGWGAHPGSGRATCERCGGSGRVRRPRNVKVRIPAGVADGQTIRLPGRGEPGYDGGPSGDLYVTVDVDPHPWFGRVGNNLTLTVPVTYDEAVLGADVSVPTLDGDSVKVRVAPGTPSGRVLRVPGRGVPKGTSPGDLLLTVDVVVPTDPSPAERDLIERLAATTDNRPRAPWETTP